MIGPRVHLAGQTRPSLALIRKRRLVKLSGRVDQRCAGCGPNRRRGGLGIAIDLCTRVHEDLLTARDRHAPAPCGGGDESWRATTSPAHLRKAGALNLAHRRIVPPTGSV